MLVTSIKMPRLRRSKHQRSSHETHDAQHDGQESGEEPMSTSLSQQPSSEESSSDLELEQVIKPAGSFDSLDTTESADLSNHGGSSHGGGIIIHGSSHGTFEISGISSHGTIIEIVEEETTSSTTGSGSGPISLRSRAASLGRRISRSAFRERRRSSSASASPAPPPRKGPKPRRTPLHKMCLPGTTFYTIEAVQSYLDSHPEHALVVDKRGMTPLHTLLAKLPHRDDIAQLLIEKAPEVCEMRDNDGMTPLHHAAKNADGVNVGMTPLHRANADGVNVDTLTALLKYDPLLALDEDRYGETPFSLFCSALERAAREVHSNEIFGDADESRMLESAYWPLLDKSVPIVRAIAWGDPRAASDDDTDQDKIWKWMLHTTLYAVERATSGIHDAGDGSNVNAFAAAHSRRYRFLVRAVLNRTHRKPDEEENDEHQQQQGEHQQEGGDEDNEQPQQQQEQVVAGGQATFPVHFGSQFDAAENANHQQHQQAQQEGQPQQPQHDGNDHNDAGQHEHGQQEQEPQHRPASEVDSRGNLALHIAANIPFLNECPRPFDGLAFLPVSLEDQVTHSTPQGGIIDALVQLHPEAASTPNAQGLLPFDIAEQQGSGWSRGGVGAMLNANRLLLYEMDLDETALPTVLHKIGRDLELGCMFDVLRERPEVLLNSSAAAAS